MADADFVAVIFASRVEPRLSATDVDLSLRAPLADPFWMLFRQRQVGEMKGDDAGVPMKATVEIDVVDLGEVRTGDHVIATQPTPQLETIVEAEPIAGTGQHGRLSAEIGQHLVRMMKSNKVEATIVQAVRDRYRLTAGDDTEFDPLAPTNWEASTLLAGVALDGLSLASDLRSSEPADLARGLAVPGTDVDQIEALALTLTEWDRWTREVVHEPRGVTGTAPRSWNPSRFEHSFEIAAQGFTVAATSYDDGELDWPDLVVRAADTDRVHETLTSIAMPTPLRFPGMPARRHFEIEDTRVSFAGAKASVLDLGRAIVANFILEAGDDWFLVPVNVRSNAVVRLRRVVVTDSFGEPTTIEPHPGRGVEWSFADAASSSGDLRATLVIPDTCVERLQGSPIEQVSFARDEMSNVVWGIERIVSSLFGPHTRPVPRTVVEHVEVPTYFVRTKMPDFWIPYLARSIAADRPDDTELRRLDGAVSKSIIITESERIEEEEVSQAGVTIERSWQLARTPSGSSVLWVGRSVSGGYGGASSGLVWDTVRMPPRTS